ncbi:hypothetical protein Nepgr_009005 [Nepenthes gracilis]|uniref:Uncharacterized protein n=1 Tax=Nepenthes gracilis TaxID=150966 RepID=A0AAD3SA50_NEPGR|nr:hypothetical protein Nepgr_009005 [Nepenthes gracilis]
MGCNVPATMRVIALIRNPLRVDPVILTGTIVVAGCARTVVIGVGSSTAMGSICDSMLRSKDEVTPLTNKLDEIGTFLSQTSSVASGFKWRSRRKVVDWLTFMLCKQQLHELTKCDSNKVIGSSVMPFSGSNQENKFKQPYSDILWLGNAWACRKQLKHYLAFCKSRTTIAIQSFVFVMAKEGSEYDVYFEDMYEDKRAHAFLKLTIKAFNADTNVVRGTKRTRNFGEQQGFLKVLKVDEKIELLSKTVASEAASLVDSSYEVGPPVFAWWSDGWWEGILVGVSNGENLFLNVLRQNLRVFRDWTGSQQIDEFAKKVYLRDDMLTTSGEIKFEQSSMQG